MTRLLHSSSLRLLTRRTIPSGFLAILLIISCSKAVTGNRDGGGMGDGDGDMGGMGDGDGDGNGDGGGDGLGGDGHSGGGSTSDGPIVQTSALPPAWFHKLYQVKLEASGDGTLSYALSEGSLPAGLTLSDDGLISGTPSETGTFSITITVTDDNGEASVELTLSVGRKNLAAYVSTEGAGDTQRLYVFDYTASAYPKTVVSTNMEDFSEIHLGTNGYTFDPSFSPDGTWIAYGTDKDVDEAFDLYISDLSSGEPSGDVKVTQQGKLQGYSWSADGEYLAYGEDGDIWLVPLRPEFGEPVSVGPGFSPVWIGSSLLSFSSGAKIFYVPINDGVIGSTKELTGSGNAEVIDPTTRKVAFQTYNMGFCAMTSYLVHFETSDIFVGPSPAPSRYSPNLQWLGAYEDSTWSIHEATAYADGGDPLLSEAGNSCGAVWAPNSRFLAIRNADGFATLLDVDEKATNILDEAGAANSGLFNGGKHYGGFSSDNRWFAFPAGASLRAWVTPLSDDGVGVSTQVESTGIVVFNEFTPNASHLVYFDYGTSTFHLAEMTNNGPEYVRELSDTDFKVEEGQMWFASDSTAFAYLAASGTDWSTRDLYVADLLDEEGVGTRVTTLQNVTGRSVDWVAFQP